MSNILEYNSVSIWDISYNESLFRSIFMSILVEQILVKLLKNKISYINISVGCMHVTYFLLNNIICKKR